MELLRELEETRWPSASELRANDVKYIAPGEWNPKSPSLMEHLITTHGECFPGHAVYDDAKEYILKFSDVLLPSRNEKDYRIIDLLRELMGMISFHENATQRGKGRAMAAGSFAAKRGNSSISYFFSFLKKIGILTTFM